MERGEGTDADPYANRFECIPHAQTYRPARRAPKPRVYSVQTATVVGPAGEEIHTDEHGRIKVLFHWDRRDVHDETASCWVRVQQSWAGPGWGFVFLPRVGMEVVVTFIDGDPDRPLVTGCVYNGTNQPPYPLPAEKTKSTMKSQSSPGGSGFNELRFEDRAGAEEIFLHGQRDWNTVVENDVTERVGHDRTRHVRNDEAVHIGRHHVQSVGTTRTRSVGEDESVSVGGDRELHIGGDSQRQVGGAERIGIDGDRRVRVQGSERARVGGDRVESVGGHRVIASGGHFWLKAKRIVLDAEDELIAKVGDTYVRLMPDKAFVESFEVFLNSAEPAPDAAAPVDPEEQ